MKKLIFLLSCIALSFGFQTEVKAQLYDLVNPLGTAAVPIKSDTVANTATAYLTSPLSADKSGTVTVIITATKISGTVAGTITLQGSLDGTTYIALTDASAVPAIATKTATDVASQSFIWRVTGNPVRYYRVSWTGTGTMSAKFSAQMTVR